MAKRPIGLLYGQISSLIGVHRQSAIPSYPRFEVGLSPKCPTPDLRLVSRIFRVESPRAFSPECLRQIQIDRQGFSRAEAIAINRRDSAGRIELQEGELAEAELQLPAFEARLTGRFEFQEDLDAKRREMLELEAELAASQEAPAAAA